MHTPLRSNFAVTAIAFSSLAACLLPFPLFAGPAEDVRALTGAQTRIVWIQDAGDTACVYSERPTLRLMGFDTDDGKGERAILPDIGWYAKPLLTADGKRVVFANLADHTVDVVNFDGTGLRQILKNEDAYKYEERAFVDDSVWTDPKNGVTWVYAMVMEQREGKPAPVIRRYQLDHPEVSELIWDKMPVSMFMVNGDGRAASGGGEGGNTPQGMFTLPNGIFAQRAGGCWPSMSPDNSLRSWVFTGNHRSIHFGVTTDASSGKGYTYTVWFDKSPGLTIKNGEEVYHPRWSNDVRFVTLDGPFSQWSWKADAKIPMSVAENVEIYIGKFTEDMKGIERWVKVTDNKHGDYWPCAWVKPPPGPPSWLASSAPVEAENNVKITSEPDRTAQVFIWKTGAEGNQIVDPKTGSIRQCIGQLRDSARYGLNFAVDLTGGAFVPDATAKPWLDAVQSHGAFAIEADITSSSGDGVVLAFADDLETGNVVLSQRGDQLMLRLRGVAGDPIPLVRLPRGRASHVIVSYAPGKLAVFVDGQSVLVANPPEVPVTGWVAQPLILGDASRGGHNWPGLMEDIGLFGREIGAAEARQRFEAQRQRSAGRKLSVPRVIVEAKLTGTCAPADPQGIAPYKRCLSLQQYEVSKVIEGTLAPKVITVAQWSVLDGKVTPDYLQYKPGQTCRLALERWEDHPEQESERQISGNFEEGELFYQVRETAHPLAAATTTAASAVPPSQDPWHPVAGHANLRQLIAPVSIQGQEKPSLFTAQPGLQLDTAGQEITFENGSLTEVANSGSLRLGGSGAVTAATAVAWGCRYTGAPALKLSGGAGQGAVAGAIMSVTGFDLASVGSGYTSPPAIAIGAPDIYGGRQATAMAFFNKDNQALTQLRVTDPGSGYLRAPRVTIEGGGGSGASATATLSVADVFVTRGGSGYTTPPTVTLTGDGAGAVVQTALQRTVLRYTGAQGNAFIRNTGAIDQDGSAILFDCAASQGQGNVGIRGLENTGLWTLRNGAVVQFDSSTGRAFGVPKITNTGTLSLLDGSRIGLQNLQNSGTLQLGAGTVLGSVACGMADCTFANTGSVQVLGATAQNPAEFGLTDPLHTGARSIVNGLPDGTAKARFIIGDGRDASVFKAVGGNVEFINNPGASTLVQPGATLALITNDNGSPHMFISRKAMLTNAGDLTLAGMLQVQGNHGGFTGISNNGRLNIQGAQAGVERLQSSAGPGAYYKADVTSSQLVNLPAGIVQGSGTFTYANSTGTSEAGYLRLFNLGAISPGGDQPGKLAFANVNVQFGGGGAKSNEDKKEPPLQGPGLLRILIASPLNYSSLQVTGDKDSGNVTLADGETNTLDVVAPGGPVPRGKYRIVTARAVKGTFTTLQYNGKAPAPYTVNYLPDGIEVVIP
ncbi:MAG: hypothetical protein WCD79_07890 [Chthoniobacteraceae bacterium]